MDESTRQRSRGSRESTSGGRPFFLITRMIASNLSRLKTDLLGEEEEEEELRDLVQSCKSLLSITGSFVFYESTKAVT